MDPISSQTIIAFIFGIIFFFILILLAIKFPNPTPFQYSVFRIILSLAGAGVAAVIPGFINVKFDALGILIRSGGAIAVFVILYFYNPAKFAVQESELIPSPPDKLPDGTPFPIDRYDVFHKVWKSLLVLIKKGDNLWNIVNKKTILDFASALRETSDLVNKNGLFFSESDYNSLLELLDSADLYLRGKERLHRLREGMNININEVRDQIGQNEKWLDKYKEFIQEIRSRFHDSIAA